jgi:ABC-type multidrug transport system ATPase subunit
MGKCRPCYECQEDDCYEGECINKKGVTSEEGFYHYYTYFVVANGSSSNINRDIVIDWLLREEVSKDYIPRLLNIIFKESNSLTFSDFVNELTLFKNIDASCLGSHNISYEGCGCVPYKYAKEHMCAKGLRCSSKSYHGISLNLYYDKVVNLYKAKCIACGSGQYCPEGTYIVDETVDGLQKIACPRGYYCPTPSQKILCSNGSFCPEGLDSPYSCNYTELVRTHLFIKQPSKNILEMALDDNTPYHGNICPLNSTSPNAICESGYYCPNSSVSIICPYGYYCKKQSTHPRECPVLSRCRQGSDEPDFVGIPYLFVGILLLIIIAILLYEQLGNKNINKYSTAREDDIEIVVSSDNENVSTFVERKLENLKNKLMRPRDPSKCHFSVIPIEHIALYGVSARVSKKHDPWLWPNNAVFMPQKLNVIIGASGCGKSTFLDLLRGTIVNGHLTGRVEIKLKDRNKIILDLSKLESLQEWREFNDLKNLRGYVPQDDIVYGDLTVKENFMYSSLLKYSTNKEDVKQVVEYTISMLGMSHIQDKIVGSVEKRGISGGQRKRVNIGMEVVTMPSLLIMDEPTSGLDANGCQSFVEFCSILNTMNITIVSVIHQPRYTSFVLFDHVILLSKYGTVFEGSPASNLLYFNQGLSLSIDKNENPADVIMDIISGNREFTQMELVSLWRKKDGKLWTQRCFNEYPFLSYIIDHNVVYDKKTMMIMHQLLQDKELLFLPDIIEIFNSLGINVKEDVVKKFIDYYNAKYNNMSEGALHDCLYVMSKIVFLKIVHEVCSQAYLSMKYDNVIDRLNLFTKTPKSIVQKYNEVEITRQIARAWLFAKNAMEKAHIIGIRNEVLKKEESDLLSNEILLLSMTCKFLYDQFIANDMNGKKLKYNISKPKTPNIFTNILQITLRKCVSIYRSPWQIQLIIPIISAFIIGNIQGAAYDIALFPNNVVYAMVCMGVLSMITHVRTFSLDKVVIRREIDCKISIHPYFIAYNIADFIWISLVPFMFVIPYYYLILPRLSFIEFYGVALMICWWSSGASYIVSAMPLALHWANLIAVFVSVIYGAFLQGLKPSIREERGTLQSFFIHNSYNRWAMEILTIKEYEYYNEEQSNTIYSVMGNIGLCGMDNNLDDSGEAKMMLKVYRLLTNNISFECQEYIKRGYLWLFGYGMMFRVIAYLIMFCNTHPIFLRFQWKIRSLFFL